MYSIRVSQGLVVDLVNIVPFSVISSRFALMCGVCVCVVSGVLDAWFKFR